MDASRWRRLWLAATMLVVAGCGGGGSESPAPPPPPTFTTLPAVTSVPAPVGYSQDQQAAFDRLNELRTRAGLGLLAQSVELDAAANAHLQWEQANGVMDHEEAVGTPSYFGTNFWDRDRAAGYQLNIGSEVLSAGAAAGESIDFLVNAVYHRQALLEPSYLDVGLAYTRSTNLPPRAFVAEIATPTTIPSLSRGQSFRSAYADIAVWPVPGARDAYTRNGYEHPSPPTPTGTPGAAVSVQAYYWNKLTVQQFSLVYSDTQVPVNAVVVSFDTDPNHAVGTGFVALVPTAPLLVNTSYEATFIGLVDGKPVAKTWKFQTGPEDWPM